MNSGHYQSRAHLHGLPLEPPQYDGTFGWTSQTTQQMPSFDGLPGTHLQQDLLDNYPSPYVNYNLAATMSMPQATAEWPSTSQPFEYQTSNGYHWYGKTSQSNDQEEAFSRNHLAEVPRTWSLPYDAGVLADSSPASRAYQPSEYMTDPISNEVQSSRTAYNGQDSSREFARLSISRSPKIENDGLPSDLLSFRNSYVPRMPASESSEESGPSSREMTAVEMEDHGADEPYAKLIYRALMSAPDHSMVLQEIYQWFRENTAKGSSDTKGWMNSIRHNLSMNAAFKKTERKISGDETKKSTEWVLEDFAIKDGVQSTTRYRKGTGSKKFIKSDTPAPARQSSGRKGGICASKTKLQRQRVRDDRSDLRRTGSRVDTARRLQSQQDTQDFRAQKQRQISPLTPKAEQIPSSSPYIMTKPEHFGLSLEEMYGLGSVQDIDVDAPLFTSDDNESPFYNSQSMYINDH